MSLPLIDGAGNDRRYFKDAVDYIDDVVSSGDRILVHCHAGRSHSVYGCQVFSGEAGSYQQSGLREVKS